MNVRPRIVEDVVRGEISDSEVVVSVRGGSRALILNSIADVVLDLCDGSRTVDEIVAFLRGNLTIPSNTDVSRDVTAVLDELLRAGVIKAGE